MDKKTHDPVQEHVALFRIAFLFDIKQQERTPSLSQWQETEIRLLEFGEQDRQEIPYTSTSSNSRIDRDSLSMGNFSQAKVSTVSTVSPAHGKYNYAASVKKSKKKGVQFAAPELPSKSITPSPDALHKGNRRRTTMEADMTHIRNVCEELQMNQQAWASDTHKLRCLGYLSGDNLQTRLGVFIPSIVEAKEPIPKSLQAAHKITSLTTLLSKQQTGSQNPVVSYAGNLTLTRGERIGLALTVASSVLQLNETPWLPENWNKSDIMVNLNKSPGTTDQNNIFEKAYITKTFPSTKPETSTTTKPKHPIIPNLTIFSLGIVLTEISLGLALETMRRTSDFFDPTDETNVLNDYATAIRLVDVVYSEAGTRYGDAVRRCLRCDFDQRSTSLSDDGFRQAVYDGVVAPLEDDFRDFYGMVG